MTKRKKFIGVILGLILPTIFCVPSTLAQQKPTQSDEEIKALRADIEAIKAGQSAIQKQLQEISNLLKTRPVTAQPAAPRDIVLDIAGAPFRGQKNAKVVLVEFSDFQCPFCGRFVRDTIPQVETDYVETGKVKYVFGDFPLETIHQYAFKAAETASCAGEQGKFWEMHDRLFANQTALKPEDLPQHAAAIGLDKTKFQQCLDTGQQASAIRKIMAQAGNAGVTGTPTIMVGLVAPNSSKVKVLRVLKGSQPFAAVKDAIDTALATPGL
jgi:protein-disulfide isomerase